MEGSAIQNTLNSVINTPFLELQKYIYVMDVLLQFKKKKKRKHFVIQVCGFGLFILTSPEVLLIK